MPDDDLHPATLAPAKRAGLELPWAVVVWIAWLLGPGSFLLSMWKGEDQIPPWLGARSPLKWVSLLLTFAMVISGGKNRATPEFWLLVVYWVSIGMVLLVFLGLPALLVGISGAAGAFAAFAFPVMGGLRFADHLRRCRARPKSR